MRPKGGTVCLASGFGALAELPWERVTDKIERRLLAGQQGMIVWWKMKAGAHAAAHRHPHEQIVWMLNGKMDFRIGNDRRSMVAGDVAVIPGNVEHEGIFPEDTDVVDIFAPPREDFLTSALSGTLSHSLASAGGSFLRVILGHSLAYWALMLSHFSAPGSVSGLIASTGHSGSQTPQSIHSSG
jgi:quercetin dioxygenase-like cupin family protein